MYKPHFLFAHFSLLIYQVGAVGLYRPRLSDAHCQPFFTTFPPSSVSSIHSPMLPNVPFTAIGTEGSYRITHGGLELYLNRPQGNINTKHGVNDKTADGATINSTFTILYV